MQNARAISAPEPKMTLVCSWYDAIIDWFSTEFGPPRGRSVRPRNVASRKNISCAGYITSIPNGTAISAPGTKTTPVRSRYDAIFGQISTVFGPSRGRSVRTRNRASRKYIVCAGYITLMPNGRPNSAPEAVLNTGSSPLGRHLRQNYDAIWTDHGVAITPR